MKNAHAARMVIIAPSARIPATALQLGLSGILPFAAGAVSQFVPVPGLRPSDWLFGAMLYGALILSFLGGIRWGTAIGPYGAERQGRDFSMSVLPVLAGWLALLLPPAPGLLLLIAGFLMQALWDVMSVETGRLPQWFGKLRMILTAAAVLSLIAMLAARFI